MVNGHSDYIGDVRKFHKVFKHPCPEDTQFDYADDDTVLLRIRLIEEEAREVVHALSADKVDLVGLADGLCDLMYVTAGALVVAGHDRKIEYTTFPILEGDDESIAWREIGWIVNAADKACSTIDTQRMNNWESQLFNLAYRILWLAANHKIPFKECFDEVQSSNMSKLGKDGKPIFYTKGPKKGKVKKGPNFKEPDLEMILHKHGLLK